MTGPRPPAPVRALAAAARALAWLEGAGLAVCLVVLTATALVQFVLRNLRLHGFPWVPAPPDWMDGVLRHAVFVLGLLGGAYAAFRGRHFRIDALVRLLPARARLAVRAATALVAAGVCAIAARGAYDFFVVVRDEGSASELIGAPQGAWIAIGGLALVGIHLVVEAALDAVAAFQGGDAVAARAGGAPEAHA